MIYDVVVIGAGLSGLAAASLLAKRGLFVAVVEQGFMPGGSCGVFKRKTATFDQGSSMMYGFGPKGFNPHRFVFNCLEEPITMIRHDRLYTVHYDGHEIPFPTDVAAFVEELTKVFPTEEAGIARFYRDMEAIYRHVMVETPTYTTPDETPAIPALKSMLKHPISYVKFLSYLNRSAKSLLKKYFKGPEILAFFDKMTSTYSYTTVEETPAVLAAVMFVDNHIGGSYYPAGSTLFVPGLMEKSIEDHQGQMIYRKRVVKLEAEKNMIRSAVLDDGTILEARAFVYSGTVWNFYNHIAKDIATPRRIAWTNRLKPTYPSVVLYLEVDKEAIHPSAQPIEMLVGNPREIDEGEVTVYIPSLDDASICDEGAHVVMAIGPSLRVWNREDKADYQAKKKEEEKRLIEVLKRRHPTIDGHIRQSVMATPKTLERYLMKENGAVAGPKQQIGQHMFRRLHTRSEWKNLMYCGESTALGTGTPAVTTSGIAAANAILRRFGKKPFAYNPDQPNVVTIRQAPYTKEEQFFDVAEPLRSIRLAANRCLFCEHPTCADPADFDVRGMNRRLVVGNVLGARNAVRSILESIDATAISQTAEASCILARQKKTPVSITKIIEYLQSEERS
jgi:prolycopene isomerase